jgi:hypothetical protein
MLSAFLKKIIILLKDHCYKDWQYKELRLGLEM